MIRVRVESIAPGTPDVRLDNVFPGRHHARYEVAEGSDTRVELRLTVTKDERDQFGRLKQVLDLLATIPDCVIDE